VTVTGADQAGWAPAAGGRQVVPVLVYRGAIDPVAFARQMALIDAAGYETITLAGFARFAAGRSAGLPPRPVLLTFDGGRAGAWTGTDGTLRRLGMHAVIFVNTGRTESRDPAYLTWSELARLQRSGRWEVQLQSGSGDHRIRYGPRPAHVGPFYAYRGAEEVLGGWRERVFSDISDAGEILAFRVPGYRPVAFAPPYGNYGQAGTNDRRIPRLLLARLRLSYRVVFTQDRSGLATPRRGITYGRIEVTADTTGEQLRRKIGTAAVAKGP
jgi:peptidoglycan/xylan/chitin deacetylase (PgdA/CDA1 family)